MLGGVDLDNEVIVSSYWFIYQDLRNIYTAFETALFRKFNRRNETRLSEYGV
jgi:hypothetical protein